jgi:hypothetical protein
MPGWNLSTDFVFQPLESASSSSDRFGGTSGASGSFGKEKDSERKRRRLVLQDSVTDDLSLDSNSEPDHTIDRLA